MRALAARLIGIATVGLLAACGGADGGTNPPPANTLDNIAVTPPTVALTAGQSATLAASGRSANGTTLSGVTIAFSSSNTSVATVSSAGVVLALSAGTATITATGTLNGTSKSATSAVTVTGTLPSAVTVASGAASNDFTPANVVLARGGTITWTFGARVHNVDFQGAANAPAGISNTSNSMFERTFATAGTFGYVCSLHSGMSGSVVVP